MTSIKAWDKLPPEEQNANDDHQIDMLVAEVARLGGELGYMTRDRDAWKDKYAGVVGLVGRWSAEAVAARNLLDPYGNCEDDWYEYVPPDERRKRAGFRENYAAARATNEGVMNE